MRKYHNLIKRLLLCTVSIAAMVLTTSCGSIIPIVSDSILPAVQPETTPSEGDNVSDASELSSLDLTVVSAMDVMCEPSGILFWKTALSW